MHRMEEHHWIEQTFPKNVWHKPECVQMTALINVIPLLSVSKVNFSLFIMLSNKKLRIDNLAFSIELRMCCGSILSLL